MTQGLDVDQAIANRSADAPGVQAALADLQSRKAYRQHQCRDVCRRRSLRATRNLVLGTYKEVYGGCSRGAQGREEFTDRLPLGVEIAPNGSGTVRAMSGAGESGSR
jgi:hypothetical protein